MGDSPLIPTPQVAQWRYDFETNGRSRATFLGDVVVDGTITSTESGLYNPYNYGAQGNGLVDDGPAIAATDAAAVAGGGQIIFPPGLFSVRQNLTIASPVLRQTGAIIQPANGVTVTFNGTFASTSLTKAFNNALAGQGTVSFNPQTNTVGYPEWFGAVTNASGVDCAPAINACIVAFPVTQLAFANYYISSVSITLQINGRTLRGVTWEQNEQASSTQILINDATLNGIVVGTNQATQPSYGYISNCTVEDLSVVRIVAPNNPHSGTLTPSPNGVIVKWASLANIRRVLSAESTIGFVCYAVVESWFQECSAIRTIAGQYPAYDQFAGFYLDYSANTGYNGGNASVYFNQCRTFGPTGGGVTLEYSAGFRTDYGFVDCFLTQLETGNLQYGIDLRCSGTVGSYATEDMQIIDCTLDSCSVACINIQGATSPYTAVTISGGYMSSAGSYDLSANGVAGAITVSGVQVFSSAVTSGFYFVNCANIVTQGNLFNACPTALTLASCNAFSLRDNINVPVAPGTPKPAVVLTGCTSGYVQCAVGGAANACSAGVSIDNTSGYIEVNLSAMKVACLPSAADLILYNNAGWGGAANFGTGCVASGCNVTSGGSVTLIQTQTLSSVGSTFTFSNIPQGYKHLQLRFQGTGATGGNVFVFFNADHSNDYTAYQLSTFGNSAFYNNSGLNMFNVQNGPNGTAVLDINNYSSTTAEKTIQCFWGAYIPSGTTIQLGLNTGLWPNTNAITEIEIICGGLSSTFNFEPGTTVSLYGIAG